MGVSARSRLFGPAELAQPCYKQKTGRSIGLGASARSDKMCSFCRKEPARVRWFEHVDGAMAQFAFAEHVPSVRVGANGDFHQADDATGSGPGDDAATAAGDQAVAVFESRAVRLSSGRAGAQSAAGGAGAARPAESAGDRG